MIPRFAAQVKRPAAGRMTRFDQGVRLVGRRRGASGSRPRPAAHRHKPCGVPDARRGQFERQPAHLIGIMATCVGLAGAGYSQTRNDHDIAPPQGVSLAPALRGETLNRAEPIYFEHEGNLAMRDGRWKLVAGGHAQLGTVRHDRRPLRVERSRREDARPRAAHGRAMVSLSEMSERAAAARVDGPPRPCAVIRRGVFA